MGTRGAVGFILDGVEHVFYNHYDSYPDGLGGDVVDFLKASIHRNDGVDGMIGELKQRVRNLVPISRSVPPTEEQKKWLLSGGYADLSVSNRSPDDWYCLLRNAQGDLDKSLEARYYEPNIGFLDDGLFCEYAYLVNLDEETLEFYEGFQERNGERHAGRYWAKVPDEQLTSFQETLTRHDGSKYQSSNDYGPVALKHTFSLPYIERLSKDNIILIMAPPEEDEAAA